MTTLPAALAWGGTATACLAIIELTFWGAAIEVESLLKYGVGFALFVFAVGRYAQKIEDSIKTLHANQKNLLEALGSASKVIDEIQLHCKKCNGLKPSTEISKKHIEIDTPKI